ncbi:MAG: hypothetical protein UY25_C0007G0026 [Candidatus Yanofskybacteria bacterium GW2011_GWC1_48_11]|uniref:Hedgehog/Intein (Hint) domain-containing protein n=2 Tax=Parcubacteria group TaxID=1794811 RepID=A0A837IN51_9BACT|nr:MAG: hypothetical protein UY25_C0007G0026 [Candidatus Yanofskybacteria bacterium GW2011_GWC1_48_11]
MNHKGIINILLIVIIVALAGFGVYVVWNQQMQEPSVPPGPPVVGPVTVTGDITCLPKIGPGPHTEECAIGLRGTDGGHYGLKNLLRYDPDYKFSATGLRVKVSGVLSREEMPAPAGGKYDVVGIIDVTSIKEVTPTPAPSPTPPSEPSSTRYREDGTCPLGYVDYGVPLQCVTPEYMEYCKTNPCPICLAENTMIDTPSGAVQVQQLQRGAMVWTVNGLGERIPGIVLEMKRTLVPSTHQIVHLILGDGRELLVSPGHPTVDGRTISNLVSGDVYDGASVVSTQRVIYGEKATYDILPSGDTGFYWADGILIGSTLR